VGRFNAGPSEVGQLFLEFRQEWVRGGAGDFYGEQPPPLPVCVGIWRGESLVELLLEDAGRTAELGWPGGSQVVGVDLGGGAPYLQVGDQLGPACRSRNGSSLVTRFGGSGFTDTELEVGRAVERLSQDWGLQPHQVSLAWLLSRPAVASAIVGAETEEEVTANATAADVTLDQAQLDALTALPADKDS
jgi:Aldo/keto reductase family